MPRPSPQTERVTAIFDLFVQTNGVGLTLSDISKRLGVNRASCLHALAALYIGDEQSQNGAGPAKHRRRLFRRTRRVS